MSPLQQIIRATRPLRRVGLAGGLCLLLAGFGGRVRAQTVTLDSLPVYEEAYRQYLHQKWRADRREFVQTNRKKWWYYLPTVGWTLGMPTISFNTHTLVQIDYDRSRLRARLESLDQRYGVDFRENLARLRIDYAGLRLRCGQLREEEQALGSLQRLQAIHDEALRAQQMSPEEHLRHRYQYEQALLALRRQRAGLAIAILEFGARCRYGLPEEDLLPNGDLPDGGLPDWGLPDGGLPDWDRVELKKYGCGLEEDSVTR